MMSKFDQRGQRIGKQFNAGRDIVIGRDELVDVDDLLASARKQVRATAHLLAIPTLREALRIDPRRRAAYYYLAVALLKGRRPKVHTRSEIEEVDQILATALTLDPQDSLF